MKHLHDNAMGLVGQIVAILFVTILLDSAASTFLYERASQFSIDGDKARRLSEHLVLSARLIEKAPEAERKTVAEELTTTRYHLVWTENQPRVPHISPLLTFISRQVVEWEPELRNRNLKLYLRTADENSSIVGAMRLRDGSWLSFSAKDHIHQLDLTFGRIIASLVPAVALIVLGSIMIRQTLRPMREVAVAAETIGEGVFKPIPVRGPKEVREVVSAFNSMQERIDQLISDRMLALAAVGHDFRTPLARLRLRADAIGNEEISHDIEQDIGEMEQMIDSLLAYLSGEEATEAEPVSLNDLAVLCATLIDTASDQGFDAIYDGPDHFAALLRPLAIKRALSNLINNALHFGSQVELRLSTADGVISMEVSDDGPGIPEEHREHVLTPFVRLDVARSRNTEGFGLGLPIVDRIGRFHGGRLTLGDSHLGGLSARLDIPIQQQ
ncbi:ATP-binding protein [Croceibacterium xixiisoli]|nr:ATP-binding protein [Croceibacterium xixiisoli]